MVVTAAENVIEITDENAQLTEYIECHVKYHKWPCSPNNKEWLASKDGKDETIDGRYEKHFTNANIVFRLVTWNEIILVSCTEVTLIHMDNAQAL